MAAQGASEMVVIITGGDPVERSHLPDLGEPTLVIAADSGLDHALALGVQVDLAVGDFDSASPVAVDAARRGGTVIDHHPAAKDATDLELALDAAVATGARRIHVVGGHGGRLDHLVANALLLAGDAHASATITAQMGAARVAVVRDHVELHGPIGDLVTLLPLHGPVRGVTTTGLLYPLTGEDLPAGTSRGVSNELVADPATVSVTAGVLLAIQPGQLGTHHQENLG